MAAPKGNHFWKLRKKHGRNSLFTTSEQLWDACCQYFDWCDKHPWVRNEAIKSGLDAGKIIQIPTERPYTISGLCVFLGCNQGYFYDFKKKCSEDFSEIITRAEEIIETQQFEGAVVGAFSQNIIARKLGLSEKKELEGNMNIRNEFEDWTDEQLENYIRESINNLNERDNG